MSHDHATPECKALLGELSDYLDGSLEQALCDELEAHLAGCEDCRVVVDTTRKTVELYGRLGRVEVPPPAMDRLWQALVEKGCV